ncbi:TetR/AcrR family transcriptional regulator [Rhodococcus sp. NPDC060090]|uniref:TetR/AcrR family transcriptional regulator n=1 Tax=Rhodococcus sp. NPDC060090 TaxID=3347056 RepID=UPI003647C08B
MPRQVDHEVRRREITDAVRRVIVSGGLEAVTFQSVAAEAGISVRLVQYYFGTKNEFLLATHRSVMEDAGARFGERLAEQSDAAPREAIRTVLAELLPLDDRRREEVIVLGAFNTAAIVGRGLAADETHAAPRALVTIVAHHLRRAGNPDGTTDLDAELVLAAVGGLAQGMLSGVYTGERAVELVDHLLDRTVDR